MKRDTLLQISETLAWIAAGCAVSAAESMAGERVISVVWPLVTGFAWIFVRFAAAPVKDDVFIHGALSLAMLVFALIWASILPAENVITFFSRKSPGWPSSLLASSTGVFIGSIVGFIQVRRNAELLDPAFLERVEESGRWSTTPWSVMILALLGFSLIVGIDTLLR